MSFIHKRTIKQRVNIAHTLLNLRKMLFQRYTTTKLETKKEKDVPLRFCQKAARNGNKIKIEMTRRLGEGGEEERKRCTSS